MENPLLKPAIIVGLFTTAIAGCKPANISLLYPWCYFINSRKAKKTTQFSRSQLNICIFHLCIKYLSL